MKEQERQKDKRQDEMDEQMKGWLKEQKTKDRMKWMTEKTKERAKR